MGTSCLLTKVTEAGDELDHRPHRLAPAPPLAYYLTYRICLGLQRPHREVLDHGIETGIIRRLPHGEFIEVHQPLGAVDDHGHPLPVPYQAPECPNG
jgi:ubiquinol-cytochrome c reductase cytochrome b subunit